MFVNVPSHGKREEGRGKKEREERRTEKKEESKVNPF